MRVGITLPTFARQAAGALGAATEAQRLGLHGVFVFDHLWPMGDPSRPSLSVFPVLGAVAARTDRIALGTLVARVGLVPDEVVLASLEGLSRIAPGRVIAGVGTGDKASEPENERLGIPMLSPASRRAGLRAIAEQLQADGVECWVGAGAEASNDVARDLNLTLNLWDVPAETVAAEVARGTTVSWAGPLPAEAGSAAAKLRELAEAGAGWVVWGWPRSLQSVVDACRDAGLELEGERRRRLPG
ncbi:MAG: LLM class flavin-dependent oxidoreductase [Acidimicrobiales bacterium]